MSKLLESRKFWTLGLDVVTSLVLFFGGKYFSANLEDVKFVIVTLQPLVGLVIAAFTVNDVTSAYYAAKLEMAKLGK